jgi:hypothetical protein
MRTKLITVFGLLALCLFASNQELLASQRAKEAAVVISTAWLALVDTGKYGESWDQAAQLFKDVMTKDKWQTSLQAVRREICGNSVQDFFSVQKICRRDRHANA